jgi:hypothetical protein
MQMTEPLRGAIEKLASMRHPSLATILRRNRYEYEAQVVEQLVAAYEEAKRK